MTRSEIRKGIEDGTVCPVCENAFDTLDREMYHGEYYHPVCLIEEKRMRAIEADEDARRDPQGN